VSGTARPRAFDLLVLGEINPDIVVRADDPTPSFGQVERWVDAVDVVAGSSSVIAAMGAARLGLRTRFVGVVGDDLLGRFMLDEMTSRGIDVNAVRVLAGVATGASVILAGRGDRAILTAPGAIPLLRASDIPAAAFGEARHVHVGSPFLLTALRPGLPGVLAAARAAGATTSVDPNWDPSGSWDDGLAAILAQTDLFLPNVGEARRLTGLDDPMAAAKALLAAGPRVVAVKLGAAGAIAVAASGELSSVPAPAVEVQDTIGAGDSFDAGFLAGWLGGRGVAGSLALAVACGALSTRGPGGVASQPTLAEADATASAGKR
jgi:sugar/nucleoside kinase (ribokinase family)